METQRAEKKQKLDVRRHVDENASADVLKLPDAALTRASTFLDFRDRVQFAMALPTWNQVQPHDVTKAIVGA